MPARYLCWAFVLLLSSCANLSTLQTAKTLKPGEASFSFGGGYQSYEAVNQIVSNMTSTTTSLKFPYVEFAPRFGVASHVDVGGKLALIGPLMGDIKYQFIDGGVFNASIGAGLGFLTYSSVLSSGWLIDAIVPLIISLDFSDAFSLYLSPKYYFRWITSVSTNHILAGTGGIKIGDSFGIMLEGTYIRLLNDGTKATQIASALFFKWPSTARPPDPLDPIQQNAASPSRRRAPVVLKASGRRIAVTHPELREWGMNERVCVMLLPATRKTRPCGKVIQVIPKGAVIELDRATTDTIPAGTSVEPSMF